MEFLDVAWHDLEVTGIHIDRSNPGYNDSMVFTLKDPDERQGKLYFEKVFWANFNMNFGIAALETILEVAVSKDRNNREIHDLVSKTKGCLDPKGLKMYTLIFNSTASELRIISKKAYVLFE